jgi:hypothetical protein
MSNCEDLIIEVTGCNSDDAAMIEHIMREDIFHSTLDWQTRSQLKRAAKQAARLLNENRDLYELERAQLRAIFEEMKQAEIQKAENLDYEI